MKRDPFYKHILERLDGSLDPDGFEACVCDLLRPEFSSLVPVRGGGDSGMDGAIADGDGPAYPLVCTTSLDVSGNLHRNLLSYLGGGGKRRKVVVATSRSLTARRKQNLEKKAEEHGFELVQVFDKEAIADRLYHSPKWCLELLELTGNAPTLSPVPRTTRPLTEHELIGREADLTWLLETSGDAVLVGQPGSGKTSLLYKLAREGRGLFIVGDDLSRVACEVREKNPNCLYLDDAHVDPDQLVRLVQMRRDLHASFSIVATVWPGGRNEVIERLGVPGTRVRELELLPRDQVVQVLRSVGLMGSTALVREIVDQARGLPGLAVTLANLCRHEGVREVALGTALKRSVHVTLKSLVGELAIEVLSCFALGGDPGMAWDAVAQALDIAPLEIRRIVAGLEASGVITDLGDGVLAVYPDTLRHALVRDMFFTGPVRLDPKRLMQSARRARGVAETLVGARAAGAPLSGEDLWPWLERADTDDVWARYAWFGREETREILQKRPDRLITVAAVGLRQAAEEVIPRLLGEAVGDPRNLDSNLTQPLRLIRDWIQEAEPGRGDALKRRRSLLEEALTWLDRGGDENTGLRACLLALSPRFEWSETDPGAGRTFTITHGYLLPEELDRLGELWSEKFGSLPLEGSDGWKEYFGLIRHWAYPEPRQGPETDHHRLTVGAMKKVAARMVRDLVGVATGRPGVLQALKGYATVLGVEMDVPLDPDYQVVFPGRPRAGEDWRVAEARQVEAATKLGERWAGLEPDLVADRMAELTREALGVGHMYPDHSRTVCQVIAGKTDRPLEWITALERVESQGGQVEPFLRRLVELDDPSWPRVAEEFLARASWMHPIVELVLSNGESSPHLLDLVLEKLDPRWADFLWTMALRGQIPEQVQRRLLEHSDDSVAGSVAVGEWEADPKGFVREPLRPAWRQAIVRSTTHEHWLGEILQADPALAREWLVHHLPRLLAMPVRYDELIVAAASRLSRESRAELLEVVPKDHWDGWIISVLIGDDLELYRSILDRPEWRRKHLDPLIRPINRQRIDEGPDLGPSWVEKARVAMAAGYPPEDLASAKLDNPKGWSGQESMMWQDWADAFQGLEGQEDSLVRRLAMAGSKLATERRDRAAKKERVDAIYGRW